MKTAPNSADRFVDAIAVFTVLAGLTRFAFARHALTSIGNGTRVASPGTSNVALADLHVAQSKLGLWIVGVGILIGVVAAVRHRLRA